MNPELVAKVRTLAEFGLHRRELVDVLRPAGRAARPAHGAAGQQGPTHRRLPGAARQSAARLGQEIVTEIRGTKDGEP